MVNRTGNSTTSRETQSVRNFHHHHHRLVHLDCEHPWYPPYHFHSTVSSITGWARNWGKEKKSNGSANQISLQNCCSCFLKPCLFLFRFYRLVHEQAVNQIDINGPQKSILLKRVQSCENKIVHVVLQLQVVSPCTFTSGNLAKGATDLWKPGRPGLSMLACLNN